MINEETRAIRRKIIGVLLRQARLEAGKSLKECAAFLGISSSTLSAYEHGRREISLPELELLAYLLKVPLEYFLDVEPENPDRPSETISSGADLLLVRQRIVGALLRQARQDAGISQKELAQVIGCSPGRIAQYEYGQRPIPILELEAIANFLGLSLSYFQDEETGPVAKQLRLYREWRQFQQLPPEVRAFVLDPLNRHYIEVARQLSEMPAGALRDLAAGLLEITL